MRGKVEVDLHAHSDYSDGSKNPEEVAELFAERSIKIAALTDHDTVKGVEQFIQRCSRLCVIPIPGIEVSTVFDGKYDAHILGLNINHQRAGVEDLFEGNNIERMIRTKKGILNLNESGLLSVTFEELTHHYSYPGYCVTLLHAMDFMVFKQGYDFETARNAVSKTEYPDANRDFSLILSTKEGIEAVLKLGGIPILAHPGELEKQLPGNLHEKRDKLYSILHKLKDLGLAGIEAFHPKHSHQMELEFAILARRLDLAVTAGSDFHGRHKMCQEVGRKGISFVDVLELIGK